MGDTHFYWICDCKSMSEVLEYDGNIAMVYRWAQEVLGYHFSVVHKPARMIIDIDSLTRRFGSLTAQYIQVVVFCLITIEVVDQQYILVIYQLFQMQQKLNHVQRWILWKFLS